MISFLSNLKLSITQWTLVSLSLALGLAVAAFKLQGSKLHAIQVALLLEQMARAGDAPEAERLAKQKAFKDAMDEYRRTR